jgi:hypothetical protein
MKHRGSDKAAWKKFAKVHDEHMEGSTHSEPEARHKFSATKKAGKLRVSGTKGAHQIGKR